MSRWTADDIPDLTGRRAIVTGANSGLGLETARQLARHGAAVTMACRDPLRGETALAEVAATAADPDSVRLATLDLSDLASVSRFADEWMEQTARLDLLVNNAGVMRSPAG